MTYDPFKHHRQSMRLKGYDYTQAGAYFVTICVKHGQCVLGDVVDGEIRLNNWGRIVDMEWLVIPELREYVALDVHAVMPNHFHGLFWILDDALPANVGVWRAKPLHDAVAKPEFGKPQKGSLGTIIGSFKSGVTKAINDLEDTRGAPFWQRGYYDQIIKNEQHLTAVRQYILNNPINWEVDKLHPQAPINKFNQRWQRNLASRSILGEKDAT